jgi:hypothetical protein
MTATLAAADSLSQLLDKLRQLPAPPKAAWKKLVQLLKVWLVSQASALPAHVPYPHQRCVGMHLHRQVRQHKHALHVLLVPL